MHHTFTSSTFLPYHFPNDQKEKCTLLYLENTSQHCPNFPITQTSSVNKRLSLIALSSLSHHYLIIQQNNPFFSLFCSPKVSVESGHDLWSVGVHEFPDGVQFIFLSRLQIIPERLSSRLFAEAAGDKGGTRFGL